MVVCRRCNKNEALVFSTIPEVLCKKCLNTIIKHRIKKQIRSYVFLNDDLSNFIISAIRINSISKKELRVLNYDDVKTNDVNLPFIMEFIDSLFLYYLFYFPESNEFWNFLDLNLPLKFISFEELQMLGVNVSFDEQYHLLSYFLTVDYDKLKKIYDEFNIFIHQYKGNNQSLIKAVMDLKKRKQKKKQ